MIGVQSKRQVCDKIFRDCDKQHTGYVKCSDLPFMLRKCCDVKNKNCSEQDIKQMCSRFHPDKDGRISEEDFLNTCEELRKECCEKESKECTETKQCPKNETEKCSNNLTKEESEECRLKKESCRRDREQKQRLERDLKK